MNDTVQRCSIVTLRRWLAALRIICQLRSPPLIRSHANTLVLEVLLRTGSGDCSSTVNMLFTLAIRCCTSVRGNRDRIYRQSFVIDYTIGIAAVGPLCSVVSYMPTTSECHRLRDQHYSDYFNHRWFEECAGVMFHSRHELTMPRFFTTVELSLIGNSWC
ncbi:hypothetical protein CDAR_46001 [Caerostris darwini]|uniref:Uncharacterized protein n=1 Tax=Caerostris darwini TaxID=1538125 RepID=A0AAV4M9A1_9ARAC|nr:hypothetical protein CDAR_46001 [Caerostris darwini]